ncbi:FHS family L-fucose permease-like MFS transporter [Leeuwenhoekiella aestuarii]|uniref:FHS family L-fucose permease-like MFS transporter n=1 Tax=Leeuwenhoekiella aestuarii TaxID=2249426 RepID=A0A4Q0NP55_9FLAO|nr:L-fucose:H+ symporter permease [Leeuwenhoekiella aestuarii]RXG11934.1 FHS family L-fucose permease-like MFS transporter [Leeuwenhoekiella aestuarii]RXG13492.1 FHS family L-fucose permease-like MFS transporter [Leeuwenhoekiella aestuarii]
MDNQSKVPVVAKSVLLPFILITSLFALWGFANDITNPMVSAFKKVLELDNFQASLVQLAFYGGYFTMALPAAIFVNRFSYKKGVLLGLGLYALGALLFYPAAAYEEFGFFLAALYILTFGLAFLETTANPYILSMGAEKTATQRLNLAQAFNPMGALLGLIVAQKFILASLQSDDLLPDGTTVYSTLGEEAKAVVRTADLAVIRDPYVLLGIVVIGFLVVISLVNMPQNEHQENKVSIGGSIKRLFKSRKFTGGVIAQAFYVGAQIMCWTYLYQYAESFGIENTEAVNYGIAALVVFLIGRWVGTALLKYVDSGKLLLFFAIGAALATLITIMVPGMIGLIALVSISFFMSIMFPTIYGIALEGQGEDAKFGAAFLVMAIVGGALMPTLQGLILDLGGSGYTDISILGVPEVNFSFILPFVCFVIIGIYGRDVYKKYNINL